MCVRAFLCVPVLLQYICTHAHQCVRTVREYKPCLNMPYRVQVLIAKTENVSCNVIKCSLDGGVSIHKNTHAAITRYSHINHIKS